MFPISFHFSSMRSYSLFRPVHQSAPTAIKPQRYTSIYEIDKINHQYDFNVSTCSLPLPLPSTCPSPFQPMIRHNSNSRPSPHLHPSAKPNNLGITSQASSGWDSLELKCSPLFGIRPVTKSHRKSMKLWNGVRSAGTSPDPLVSIESVSRSEASHLSILFEQFSIEDQRPNVSSLPRQGFTERRTTFVFDVLHDPITGEITFQDLTITTPTDVFGSITQTHLSSHLSSSHVVNHCKDEKMVNVEEHAGQFLPTSPETDGGPRSGGSTVRKASVKPFALDYTTFPRHARLDNAVQTCSVPARPFKWNWHLQMPTKEERRDDILVGPKNEVKIQRVDEPYQNTLPVRRQRPRPLNLDGRVAVTNSIPPFNETVSLQTKPSPVLDEPEICDLGYDCTQNPSDSTDDSSTVRADSPRLSRCDDDTVYSNILPLVALDTDCSPPNPNSSGWPSDTSLDNHNSGFPNFQHGFDLNWSCVYATGIHPLIEDPRDALRDLFLNALDNPSPVKSQCSVDSNAEDFALAHNFLRLTE